MKHITVVLLRDKVMIIKYITVVNTSGWESRREKGVPVYSLSATPLQWLCCLQTTGTERPFLLHLQ